MRQAVEYQDDPGGLNVSGMVTLADKLPGRYNAIIILACDLGYGTKGQHLLDSIAQATKATSPRQTL